MLPMNPTEKGLTQAWSNFDKGQKAELFKKKQVAINAFNAFLMEMQKTELVLYRLGCLEEMLESDLNDKIQSMNLKITQKEESHTAKAVASHDPTQLARVEKWKEMQKKMNPIAAESGVSSDSEDVSSRMEYISIDEKSTGRPRKKKGIVL